MATAISKPRRSDCSDVDMLAAIMSKVEPFAQDAISFYDCAEPGRSFMWLGAGDSTRCRRGRRRARVRSHKKG